MERANEGEFFEVFLHVEGGGADAQERSVKITGAGQIQMHSPPLKVQIQDVLPLNRKSLSL